MKLYSDFSKGVMNTDLSNRYLPKGFLKEATNARLFSIEEDGQLKVKHTKGIELLLNLQDGGEGSFTNGVITDEEKSKIYWCFINNSGVRFLYAFDVKNIVLDIILLDDRNEEDSPFYFEPETEVDMSLVKNSENGDEFIFVTCDKMQDPLFIDLSKNYGASSFTLEQVSLLKKPPLFSPTITLSEESDEEDFFLRDKFLTFAYRYKIDGQWTTLSPFSLPAFEASDFSYNFIQSENKSMYNKYSKATVQVNTGGTNVTDFQIVAIDSNSTTGFIIDTINKQTKGLASNFQYSYEISSNNNFIALDSSVLNQMYDNVPRYANNVSFVENRVVFANFIENYNLIDEDDNKVNVRMTLDNFSDTISNGTATASVKSIRDYEVFISYLDGKGRQTTPLKGGSDASVTLGVGTSSLQNKLRVEIPATMNPPKWATHFRFFLKEPKENYETVSPIIFYRDGAYGWFKLEGDGINKIKEGDVLIVKSDTSGKKNKLITTKVLEVKSQDRNFLQLEDSAETFQESGVYFKLEVDGFAASEQSIDIYTSNAYGFRSKSTSNNIGSGTMTNYLEDIVYYGSGKNDISHNSTYTGTVDKRYEIEIVSSGSPDTFRWRELDVSKLTPSSWSPAQTMTTSPFALSDGVEITFSTNSGHVVGTRWVISAKSPSRHSSWANGARNSAIINLNSRSNSGDDSIKTADVIKITYDDSASSSGSLFKQGYHEYTFVSQSDYVNIEEWFYEENIIEQIDDIITSKASSENYAVMFRRGISSGSNNESIETSSDTSDPLWMMLFSQVEYSGDSRARVESSLKIQRISNPLIFESQIESTEPFLTELSRTYPIINGRHSSSYSGDISQTTGSFGRFVLPYFNCFSWGNAFESNKIGDLFNGKMLTRNTRVSVDIDNYSEIHRRSDLTFSGIYEPSTGFNELNRFDLSRGNYFNMDINYGSIKKILPRNSGLVCFQHQKTSNILINKSVLYNVDGTGNVGQNNKFLSEKIYYTGEYGIGDHPESIATNANRIYHLDAENGALLRLSVDGYTEISKQGMINHFKNINDSVKIPAGYDVYNDEYIIKSEEDRVLAYKEGSGFTSFFEYTPDRMFSLNGKFYSIYQGKLHLHDSDNEDNNNLYGVQRNTSVTIVINDNPTDVKFFKSLNVDSNISWNTELSTDINETYLDKEFFVEMESEYYSHIRQATPKDKTVDFNSIIQNGSYEGVGEISEVTGDNVYINGEISRSISVGDVIYKEDGTEISAILAINREDNFIELSNASSESIVTGDFIIATKDSIVSGDILKGHWLQLKLTSSESGDADIELYNLKLEASKSFD